jgi:tol-pal system protein YbgF
LALACYSGLFGGGALERDMARTAADIDRIYQLNSDTQKIVETRLKAMETRQQTQSELTMRSLAELEQRVEALQETLGVIRTQVEELRYRTLGESPDRIPLRVGQGDRTSTVVLEGEQLFLSGRNALERGDYNGSRTSFQTFLNQFAASARAAEAQVWIGETFYREGKYKEAATAYQVVEQRYLTSRYVPEALMKIALCQEQLGQKEQAIATIERVIAKYPRWEKIENAQEMLRRLAKIGLQVPPAPAP